MIVILSLCFVLSAALTSVATAHAGPGLGAHNQEILGGEIGLSDAEIERLKIEGVI